MEREVTRQESPSLWEFRVGDDETYSDGTGYFARLYYEGRQVDVLHSREFVAFLRSFQEESATTEPDDSSCFAIYARQAARARRAISEWPSWMRSV